MNPTDHIQVVTFQLAGLEPDAYRAHCEASAPRFARSSLEASVGLPVSLDELQPRLYSISSSPKMDVGRVSLTVDAVRYNHRSRLRLGVASTHLGEETAVIDTQRRLKTSFRGLLTILVPRHPERGSSIASAPRLVPIPIVVVVAQTGRGTGFGRVAAGIASARTDSSTTR